MRQTILLERTKTIAMMVLIVIATVGAVGIAIETGIQSVQARHEPFEHEPGQSGHDFNGDIHSGGHA